MSLSRKLDHAIGTGNISQIKQFSDADLLAILEIGNNSEINWGHPLVQTHACANTAFFSVYPVYEEIFEYMLAKMETYLQEGKLTIDDTLKTCLTGFSFSLMFQANSDNPWSNEKIINYISRLILLGIDVNASMEGETVLYFAVKGNYASIVRLLLLKGADPTIECNGRTAYKLAEEEKKTAILDVMKKHARRIISQYALTLDIETGIIKFNNDSLSLNGAISKYTQALACDPKNSLIYLFRGMVYFWQGNAEAGEQDFDMAQEPKMDPVDQRYYRLCAVAFFQRERYMAALNYFKGMLPYKKKVIVKDYSDEEGYSEEEKEHYSFELGMMGLCYLALRRQDKGYQDKAFEELYLAFSIAKKPSAFFMPYFYDFLLNAKKGYLEDKKGEEIFAICKKFPVDMQKSLLIACQDVETGLGDRIQKEDSSRPVSTWVFGGLSREIFWQLKAIDPDYQFPIAPHNSACMYGGSPVASLTSENLENEKDRDSKLGLFDL